MRNNSIVAAYPTVLEERADGTIEAHSQSYSVSKIALP